MTTFRDYLRTVQSRLDLLSHALTQSPRRSPVRSVQNAQRILSRFNHYFAPGITPIMADRLMRRLKEAKTSSDELTEMQILKTEAGLILYVKGTFDLEKLKERVLW